ncbi:hypothetical protein [Paenibacillus sp.]|uniref:hypothetical protein n=1 Tax=Paenibacillus sp. TaxID=58172 RepID=UPI002D58874F|nr:hypothetical protein [Paenibacillus sp.]HZG86722.1 hypothetical protein [Paenibacillus sp.]
MGNKTHSIGVVISSLLSICVGYLYIRNVYFDFSWLGVETGSENEAVSHWSVLSIILGLVTILSLYLVPYRRIKLFAESFIFVGMLFLFILQLLPLTAWIFVLYFVDRTAGYVGVIPHCGIIASIIVGSYGLFQSGVSTRRSEEDGEQLACTKGENQ